VNYPLALAYRQVGRLDEAEAHLLRRGDAQPPLADPLMRELADILQSPVVYEGRGDRALARGDVPTALQAFRRAFELAPDRRALKEKLATALALSGDVPSAVKLYQELLAQDPNFAEAHYSLGALFLGSGQLGPAIDRFAAAVRADPGYLQARLQLGHALRHARAFDRALAAYQGALSVDPRFAEARLGYAVTLADAGRYAAARTWLNEGRRAYPERLEFVELLVRVLSAAPDPHVRDGRMAADLGEGLVRQARTWRTLEALAMALAETGRWTEAVGCQREAIEAFQRVNRATSPAMSDELRRFERHEPSRVPWSTDPL
jgi:tetratricopeptide (TPR) repeat protein